MLAKRRTNMDKAIKRIEELKRQIMRAKFKKHLYAEDYKSISHWEDEIKELKSQVKGMTGIAVHVTYKDTRFSDGWYLGDDAYYCCSEEPVLFESLEEAEDYLSKADFHKDEYNFEFVEMTL